MAYDNATEADDNATETATPAKRRTGGILRTSGLAIVLFLVLTMSQLTTAIVVRTLYPTGAAAGVDEEEFEVPESEPIEAPSGPPQYTAMDPPLVVSLADGSVIRFLQVKVEVMSRDENAIAAFEAHSPVIRNNLLMLFGSQQISDLTTREGKENLRQASLREVQSILEKNDAEHASIEELYFTSFVVQ